jgi:hypothetical protein
MKGLSVKALAAGTVAMVLGGCGNGSLSRGKAEDLIEKKLNETKEWPTVDIQVGKHYFNLNPEKSCLIAMKSGSNPAGYVPYRTHGLDWSSADKEGFIAVETQEYAGRFLGSDYRALQCTIKLTDKAQPFVKQAREDVVTLGIADGADVEVTGVTKPADMGGQTFAEAEYKLTYKLNALGKALKRDNETLAQSRDRKEGFRLFDDGWRL